MTPAERPDGPILYVVNGPQNFLIQRAPIATSLQEAGYDIHVAGPKGPGTDRIIELGFPYHPIRLRRDTLNPWREAHALRDLTRLYRELEPALVHQFTIKPVVWGSIAARRTPIRAVVSTITGLGFVFSSGTTKAKILRPVVSGMYRYALRDTRQRIVFQNEDDQQWFLDRKLVRAEQAALIRGSGIDLATHPVLPPARGPTTITLVARLLEDKGVREFVDAARALRDTDIRFRLVGDPDPGNPAAIPDAELRSWRTAGTVDWTGWQDDIQGVLRDTHIACLPSYREGTPRYLLEAAAAGRPIVTTDVPGCRQVVRHDDTGLLVPPRDAAALRDAILRLATDPELQARMGHAARAHVEAHYGRHSVVTATTRLYDSLLQDR